MSHISEEMNDLNICSDVYKALLDGAPGRFLRILRVTVWLCGNGLCDHSVPSLETNRSLWSQAIGTSSSISSESDCCSITTSCSASDSTCCIDDTSGKYSSSSDAANGSSSESKSASHCLSSLDEALNPK